MLEASPPALQPISPEKLDLQALEVSADAVAARFVLLGFLNHSPLAGIYADLKSVRDKLVLWGLVMFTLHRLMHFRIDPATMHLGTHPHPAMRFAILMAYVSYDALTEIGGIEWDEYAKLVKIGQLAAERGIVYCGGKPLKQEQLVLLRDPAVQAHRDRLFEHADSALFPDLAKCAHINITQN